LKDSSVEQNLEHGDELETINAFPGSDALHHSLCELQNNLYNPNAAEIAGNEYEEMIDAFEQFSNIFRKVNSEQQKQTCEQSQQLTLDDCF
jgi:hypothetical protein